MARNLNLAATLNLNAKGFQNGLNAAIRSMENFRRDFLSVVGALGAGVGLGSLVSSLKDTATQLSVARATLKNTSNGIMEFKDNLKFVDDLAKTYHQDLLVLTDGFAKFHAASMGTNFSLEQQKELYQGLTQAATFFHMSSERTQNMLIAVEQMMSKGKVTAEELRRQLGNNLPGAYARVAQAAIKMGQENEKSAYASVKSFADFESAMKKGQIGVDVLLQFVKDLNETTKNFDTNSLQLAMNDLKNTWTEFVDSTDFENLLKGIYSTTSSLLRWLKDNISAVGTAISSILVGTIAKRLIPAIVNIGKVLKGISWGSWVGLAVAALTSLISYLVRVQNKIHAVNKELKEIAKIEDKTMKIARLQEMYREGEAYVNANKDKYAGYNSLKEYKTQFINPMGTPARGSEQKIADAAKYFEYLENLPKIKTDIERLQDEVDPNGQMHPDRTDQLEPYTNSLTGDGKPKGHQPKTVKDYVEEYEKEVQKIRNQYQAGAKTLEEANDDLDKLSVSAWENITAFDDFRGKLDALPENLRQVGDELEGAFYSAKARKAQKEAEKEAEKLAEKWKKASEAAGVLDEKYVSGRSTRFDYRKTEADIAGEEADWWKELSEDLEDLKKHYEELGDVGKEQMEAVAAAMKKAQEQAKNWADARDIAEWRQEIEKLEKEYNEGLGKGFMGLAQNIESVARGWKQVAKTMKEDSDATDLDKFVAVFNEIIQTLQTLAGIIETINNLTEIGEQLAAAKNATELQGLSTTIDKEALLTSGKIAELAVTKAGTIEEEKQAGAALLSTSAKSGEAIANATKSGAALPFPANLAAIAAGVSAVVAALSMIKGFANGGFVGNNSRHGDHNLIAANSGELVLTTNDQAKLYKAIKTGNFGGGGTPEITFRLRGQDIIGAIQNTNAKRRG